MAQDQKRVECPECAAIDRRDFMVSVGAAALATGALGIVPRGVLAAPSPKSKAESAVARLFDSLSETQRKEVVLSWDDARRMRISANWHVTNAHVKTFSPDQRKIIDEILRGVTSEDGYQRFVRQTQDDNGGIDNYAVAIFGNPHEGKFEFELTGRHLTLRADGDCVPGAAFGGPIVYGHGADGNSGENLFFHQTKRVNEVFKALEGEQRKKALLARAPAENAVQLREAGAELPGIAGKDLSPDQRELVGKVLADILAPYRQEDIDEVMECVKAGGGFEAIHLAFYQTGDLGEDGVWDIWRLEGPTLVCHFRGAPHVHAYINIARKA
jgi:hypothetical protein